MQKHLLDSSHFNVTISRLCHQLIENHRDFSNSVLIGIQTGGVYLAQRIHHEISALLPGKKVLTGNLDVTFYRDDFRRREIIIPSSTEMDFIVEDKNIILIDDVLFTGRTIKAGIDALFDFGRPRKVELLTLVDRRYSRQLPISPDYVGITVDTIISEDVRVQWKERDGEDGVWLDEKKH